MKRVKSIYAANADKTAEARREHWSYVQESVDGLPSDLQRRQSGLTNTACGYARHDWTAQRSIRSEPMGQAKSA